MRIRIDGEEHELTEKAFEAARRVLEELQNYDERISKALRIIHDKDTLAKSAIPKRRARFHIRDERTLQKGVADWTTDSQFGSRSVDTGSSGPNYKYNVPIPQSAPTTDFGQLRTSMEAITANIHEVPRPSRNREDYYFRDGKSFPVYGARDYHLAAHAFWDEEIDPRLIELAQLRADDRIHSIKIDPWQLPDEAKP